MVTCRDSIVIGSGISHIGRLDEVHEVRRHRPVRRRRHRNRRRDRIRCTGGSAHRTAAGRRAGARAGSGCRLHHRAGRGGRRHRHQRHRRSVQRRRRRAGREPDQRIRCGGGAGAADRKSRWGGRADRRGRRRQRSGTVADPRGRAARARAGHLRAAVVLRRIAARRARRGRGRGDRRRHRPARAGRLRDSGRHHRRAHRPAGRRWSAADRLGLRLLQRAALRTLILGGTREARVLAETASGERGFEIVSSLAGRVRDPLLPVGQVRIGGFGGVDGLRTWLSDNRIEVVVDATHPFAAGITDHAAAAAASLGLPILHVRRPGWTQRPGDRWIRVPDLSAAATAVAGLGDRIFLTIGRQGVSAFAALRGHWFLIRAIDPPEGALPPRHELLLARGPFTVADETALLAAHRITALVTKDSGGAQTEAKLDAARARGLPVVVVDRPPLPAGARSVESAAAAWDWLRAAHRLR
ncbi:cobalt-precorrin-6A reductase [Nocardia otitidiscaviarum]|nr:cobalt-precorrin-6A reductase [Nocardia otitidiscaviarum]